MDKEKLEIIKENPELYLEEMRREIKKKGLPPEPNPKREKVPSWNKYAIAAIGALIPAFFIFFPQLHQLVSPFLIIVLFMNPIGSLIAFFFFGLVINTTANSFLALTIMNGITYFLVGTIFELMQNKKAFRTIGLSLLIAFIVLSLGSAVLMFLFGTALQ